jgi:hypothetical protein
MMAEHLAKPFPSSVVKGTDVGGVDVVMIDADIYGWALQTANGTLTPGERERLGRCADALAAALPQFPPAARPYYGGLLDLANEALALS